MNEEETFCSRARIACEDLSDLPVALWLLNDMEEREGSEGPPGGTGHERRPINTVPGFYGAGAL